MFTLILGISAAIAIGCLVTYAIVLAIRWLKDKIKEKFAVKKAKKVAVTTLENMIGSCDNTVPIDQIDQVKGLSDMGYSHLIATVDNSGKVSDVEIIKDTSDTIDEEVEQFINCTGEGMVVITN